jgi:hypothetical protein
MKYIQIPQQILQLVAEEFELCTAQVHTLVESRPRPCQGENCREGATVRSRGRNEKFACTKLASGRPLGNISHRTNTLQGYLHNGVLYANFTALIAERQRCW